MQVVRKNIALYINRIGERPPMGNPSVKNQRFLPPPLTQGRLKKGLTESVKPFVYDLICLKLP